jgi:hypothetical protein
LSHWCISHRGYVISASPFFLSHHCTPDAWSSLFLSPTTYPSPAQLTASFCFLSRPSFIFFLLFFVYHQSPPRLTTHFWCSSTHFWCSSTHFWCSSTHFWCSSGLAGTLGIEKSWWARGAPTTYSITDPSDGMMYQEWVRWSSKFGACFSTSSHFILMIQEEKLAHSKLSWIIESNTEMAGQDFFDLHANLNLWILGYKQKIMRSAHGRRQVVSVVRLVRDRKLHRVKGIICIYVWHIYVGVRFGFLISFTCAARNKN